MATCKRCQKTAPEGRSFCLECLNPETIRFWCSSCGGHVHFTVTDGRKVFVLEGIRPVPTGGALIEFLDKCPSCCNSESAQIFAFHMHQICAESQEVS